MRSKTVTLPFIISIILFPVIFGLVFSIGGSAHAESLTLGLFGATVVVELLALSQAVSARRLFSRSDPGRLTWTLITAFLIVRLLAEARLTTMNFQLVPKYSDDISAGLFFYLIVLRYLYTASDLLFIGALVTTIRAYKGTGLKFSLLAIDWFYIAILWMMPVVTYLFRENLIYSSVGVDNYIAVYRLVAVTVGALIASLCLVVRRYLLQMGGGAVARVWSAVVTAGIVRAASFLVLALFTSWSKPAAGFAEQYLLWIFASCWLIAALYQRELIPVEPEAKLEPATSVAR
jgi:hypothetical protein